MRLLIALGARPAEGGEFTRRAFLNGRIDLSQAEAVMGVIGARSAAALTEEALLNGGAGRFVKQAQEKLTRLIAGVEACLDYPDEIDETEAVGDLQAGLVELAADLNAAVDERGARILRKKRFACSALRPPQRGKALFNALLEKSAPL